MGYRPKPNLGRLNVAAPSTLLAAAERARISSEMRARRSIEAKRLQYRFHFKVGQLAATRASDDPSPLLASPPLSSVPPHPSLFRPAAPPQVRVRPLSCTPVSGERVEAHPNPLIALIHRPRQFLLSSLYYPTLVALLVSCFWSSLRSVKNGPTQARYRLHPHAAPRERRRRRGSRTREHESRVSCQPRRRPRRSGGERRRARARE